MSRDRKPSEPPESQRIYSEAPVALVLKILTAEPRTFEEICGHPKGSVFEIDGYPVSRAEAMIALHRLVKEGAALRTRAIDGPSRYSLAEGQ